MSPRQGATSSSTAHTAAPPWRPTPFGALSPERSVQLAAKNLDRIFLGPGSLELLEDGASQMFPADELAGGSTFCYFGPTQKSQFLATMQAPHSLVRLSFVFKHSCKKS